MKKLSILCGLVLAAFFSQPLTAQVERNVADFHSIEVHNAIIVHLSQGDKMLSIRTDDDNTANIITEVVDGVLNISLRENSKNQEINISISTPELKSLELHGASQAIFRTSFKTENITMEMHGSSLAEVNLNCSKLTLECHGASKVNLSGKAGSASIELSGASNLDASGFKVDDMQLEAHSASMADVNAGNLKVEASGASKILYAKGNLLSHEETSGAASVKMKG